MSNFLEGYEDVNARIIRARAEFPTMRLVVMNHFLLVLFLKVSLIYEL